MVLSGHIVKDPEAGGWRESPQDWELKGWPLAALWGAEPKRGATPSHASLESIVSEQKAAFLLHSGDKVGRAFILCDIWPSISVLIHTEISLEREKKRSKSSQALGGKWKPSRGEKADGTWEEVAGGCRRWHPASATRLGYFYMCHTDCSTGVGI